MADAKDVHQQRILVLLKCNVMDWMDITSKMANVGNATKITHSFAMKLIVINWMDITSKMATVHDATKITYRVAMKLIVIY